MSPGLLAIVLFVSSVASQYQEHSICSNKHCECSQAVHPQWMQVYCDFNFENDLIMNMDNSLEYVTDIEVMGANQVVLEKNALYYARNLRRLTLRNCTSVLFKSRSIIEISSASLRIEVVKSDYVAFEKLTYATNRRQLHQNVSYDYAGSMTFAGISLYLELCNNVLMASQVFSNIQDVNMTVISNLRLAEGALQLDPKAIVSHHGPELIIEWNEVGVKELPKDTFATSAARIHLQGVRVDTVHRGAFSAMTINHLSMLNCEFGVLRTEAFKDGILIENLDVEHSVMGNVEPSAIVAGISSFSMKGTWFNKVQPKGIDISAARVELDDNKFSKCYNNSIRISKFSNLTLLNNKFISFEKHGFDITPVVHYSTSTLILVNNTFSIFPEVNNASLYVTARGNHYGLCHCSMGSSWMTSKHLSHNFCNGHELKCNGTSANITLVTMTIDAFLLTCKKEYVHKDCKNVTVIDSKNISLDRDIFTVFVLPPLLTIVAIFFFFFIYCCTVGRQKYRVCCNRVKDTCKGLFLVPFCFYRSSSDIETTRSISQLPVPNEYTEMQSLNGPRKDYVSLPMNISEVYTADKATQSLPEELTKEFLDSLKQKLDNPDTYDEAKHVVDYLYELIKAEETCNVDIDEENIYDLPVPPLELRLIDKNKEYISVGCDTPLLEELLPFSPYDRTTGLCHEYFEPKDIAIHVYAEISNYARSAKGNNMKCSVPDVLAGQAIPRGPFLRAMQHKKTEPTATIRSNGSVSSNISAKMINRPLPAQPNTFDPGEGTSARFHRK